MGKITPTAEQLKIRFEAEYEYFSVLPDEEKAGLFNMVFGWMENCTDREASTKFLDAVEYLQKKYYPVATEKDYKVAQEVAEAIDGLQKAAK